MSRQKLDVQRLGQVFTPPTIVDIMLGLRQRTGTVLEPSCGDGAFSSRVENCHAIEFNSRNTE